MVVDELWRYPIKSLGGERVGVVDLDTRGVAGDRLWALVDGEGRLASGKDARRFRKVPDLMLHTAALVDGRPLVDGAEPDPAALAGPGWTLRREGTVPHHDAAPVHLATTATLGAFGIAAERLRPNVVVAVDAAGFVEDGWIGRTLTIGEVVLRVVDKTQRCVMVNHPRRGLPADPTVLKAIGRGNEACAGVYADVVRPGRIEVGARVELS